MSLSYKAQGMELLKSISALSKADVISKEEYSEFARLIQKGLLNQNYYHIIKSKLEASVSQSSLTSTQKCLYDYCISILNN